MYKAKDRKTLYLFEELFPFGGKLDENNRWLRISELIPWDELENSYCSYFSHTGSGRGRTGYRPLPHHRTCGFPHPAVEPGGISSPRSPMVQENRIFSACCC